MKRIISSPLLKTSLSILLMFTIVFMAACTTKTSTTATTAATTTSASGGTLHIGWTGWDEAGLNPFNASTEDDYVFLTPIYEPLAMPMSDGSAPQPWLAKSWDFDASTDEWTIHLDPSAHWSDGQPVTADDVKFTFEACWQYGTSMASDLESYVKSIDVIDSKTVVFEMSSPCAAFEDLALGTLIMPQHIWASVGDVTKYTNPTPVGSGPFLFKSMSQGNFLDLVRDPNYWKGPAHINEVIIEVVTNDEAGVVALEKGEIDILPSMGTYSLVANLEKSQDATVYVETNPHVWYLAPNERIYPLNLLAVRQAISLAVGRQDLIDSALDGYGDMPLMGYIPPSVTAWANTSVTWPGLTLTDAQRYAQANALLDNLGFTKGSDGIRVTNISPANASTTQLSKMEFSLYLYNNSSYVEAAGIIQQDLLNIGIKLDINVVDPGTLYGGIVFSSSDVDGWDILEHGSFTDPDPKDLAEQYAPLNPSIWDNGPAFGWPQYDDPAQATTDQQLVTLLQKTMTDTDPTTRYNDVQQAQVLFSNDLPVITLGHKYGIEVYSQANFTGWDIVPIHYGAAIHGLDSLQNLLSLRPK